MKNQVLTSLITFGFAALLGSTPAAAQNPHTATIPFSFEAGGVEYPEGAYIVRSTPAAKMVTLTNLTTLHSVMIPTPVVSGAKRPANPELVFAKSGQTMRLSEVWLDGAPGLLTLSKSKEASAKVAVKVN